MDGYLSAKPNRTSTSLRFSAIVLSAVLAATFLSGCSAMGSSGSKAESVEGSGSTMPSQASATAPKKMLGAGKMGTTSTGATCAECGGKGKAPQVKGTAAVVNGVQMVKVGVTTGYYQPNDFTVKAGMPVMVMFQGTSSDCLGHPTFKTLGKKGDLSRGAASVDLGILAPGAYTFTCGMGANTGTITVQ